MKGSGSVLYLADRYSVEAGIPKVFDKLMKSYLSGRMDAHEIEAAYYSYLINAPVHI